MNKLQQLIEAAKADALLRNPDALNGYGDTILELCALLEKAEEALVGVMSAADKVAAKQHAFDVANDNFSDPRPEGESLCQALIAATEADNTANEALAAIKQWRQT